MAGEGDILITRFLVPSFPSRLLTSRQCLVSSTKPSSSKYTPTVMKTIAGMGSSKEGLLMDAGAGFHGPGEVWISTEKEGGEVGLELHRMPGGAES